MKYKIGDKVRVRKNLQPNIDNCGAYCVLPKMAAHHNEDAFVTSVYEPDEGETEYGLDFPDTEKCVWTECMLEPAANTLVEYMYRDGANYKLHLQAVLKGSLTDAKRKKIFGHLNEGLYFLPAQVGLPEKRFDTIDDTDGIWFEMQEISQTCAEPTVNINASDFYEKFVTLRTWGEDAALRRMERAESEAVNAQERRKE